MAERSTQEFYREYLRDYPERDPSPWNKAIAAAGVIGGGLLAFKSGAMRPMVKGLFEQLGKYRNTKLGAVSQGLRNWTERPFVGGGTIQYRAKMLQYDIEDSLIAHQRRKLEMRDNPLIKDRRGSATMLLTERRKVLSDANLIWNQMSAESRAEAMTRYGSKERWEQAFGDRLSADVKLQNTLSEEAQETMLKQTGYRHATVRDVVNSGHLDPMEEAELRMGQTDIGDDFMDKMYDKGVLFNPTENKFSDIRDFQAAFSGIMDSIADDYTTPFAKINPIRMMYLNQFSTNRRMPTFEILERGTIQPKITKGTDALTESYVFSNGNVFNPTNFEENLMENVRLVDAKAGPIARYLRNMSGVSTSRYQEPAGTMGKARYATGRFFDIGFQDEPIGRDISWNFGTGANSYEMPNFFDPMTWPSYMAQKIHQVAKPYSAVNRIRLEDAFGKNAKYLVFGNYKTVDQAGGYKKYFNQFNAGRNNMEDVTTATLFPYAFFERLNSTLNQVGLGLSNQNLGSATDIAKNLFLRRFLPVAGTVAAWDYMNTLSEDVFGFQPEDAYAKFYVGASQDAAKLRDALGITEWAKDVAHLMPGGEQIAEIPFVGGLFDWNDTEEETMEYWRNGEDPIRKGRFWEFGNTPYTGSKIDHYEPNWVRRTLSDYKFTDTLYGSRDEYFANAWFPTPTHPFAPIRHFITDPYHYEEKHYYDRPYMLTNGFSEIEDIPLIGPGLNNVASFLFKPNIRMHEEYWDASTNEEGQIKLPTRDGNIVLPGFDSVVDDFAVDPIANMANGGRESFSARDARIEAMTQAATTTQSHEIDGNGMVVRRTGPLQEIPAEGRTESAAYITASGQVANAQVSKGMIRDLNERLKEKGLAGVGAVTGDASQKRMGDGLTMTLPGDEIVNQSDTQNLLSNMYYNLTEMGGAYGFFTTTLAGPLAGGPVMADPNDMSSFKRTFWDANLGNIGGDANEIFRRFLPKNQTQETYNPIPNQMPSWMPGENYFTDFQHGDPYTKVARGEMRLPGEAYEALHNIDVDDDLSIGASFIGKDVADITNHLLRRDEIKDEDENYVLSTGSDWHERWEAQMQREGIALDFEQYVSVDEMGVGGFYDVKADHAKWLEKVMAEADVFKYYSNEGGDPNYGNFYSSGKDIKAMQQQNPEEFRQFIRDSLDGAPMALLDPKTMSSKKYDKDEMFFNNVQQVNFYLYATGQKRGYLVHVNREDIEDGDNKEGMKVYAFDYNPQLLEYSMSKVEAARNHIRQGMQDGTYGRGDFYDYIDRFRILADVAPYSQEYRDMQKQIRSWEYLTDEQREEVNKIEDQVSSRKENVRMYPYRFKTANIEKQTVTVREVLDNNTFLTNELDNPVRLAGVRAPSAKDDPAARKARDIIGLKVGQKVTIGVDADEMNRVNNDTYQTISAVVYNKGINVNRRLIDSGVGKERENDYTPTAVHARFSSGEIMFGSLWETIAHLDTPYNTKLMQVRSPLESYQRREVYNKDWQSWGDPVNDFFIPWYQNTIARNPIMALIMGTTIGSLFGNTRYGKIMGGIAGFASSAIGVSYVQAFEATHERDWIPERRLKEWEMSEYLDIMKYVKNRRLYEEAANIALEEDGFDVRRYLSSKRNQGDYLTSEKRTLEQIKRKLKVGTNRERDEALKEARDMGYQSEGAALVKELNSRLKEIAGTRKLESIPDSAAKAIAYYNESEKTMYAYDPGEPLANVLAALPKKDKDYLQPFMNAPEEERDDILRVTPDYIRRILQASWGMEVDEKDDLVEYFETHGLPDEDWIGWDQRASLKDLKVKMVKKHKLDKGEFDIWPDDVKEASYANMEAPNLNERNSEAEVRNRLRDVLSGIGLENVDIHMTPTNGKGSVDINVAHDRRMEIRQKMNEEAANLI